MTEITGRVTLVPLTVADADEMVGVLAGDLYAFTGGTAPTLDELRTRYARQVTGGPPGQQWHNWIIRVAGEAVGYVQATITHEGRRAEIAWVVGERQQGHGYATEAARALVAWLDEHGVTTVEAHIHPDHAASAAVARRAGLTPTGRFDDGERLWRRGPA
ncbi:MULTISPECIES: GNAT family N-acetyltransferase [Nonomuraea]|uniref:GNAT family N-acetyltransferase n=1 Tax=Nonomuraea TaxID=83681 RepID=UPI001C5D98B9|nr:GNAT family N-acetyltransferase [Nonomuraea ceibae]